MKRQRRACVWFVAIVALVALCPAAARAQTGEDNPGRGATVIILRHAEKAGDQGNVELSSQGRERADLIAYMCGSVGPAVLYGVVLPENDIRIRQTLAPLAARIGVEPIILTAPQGVEAVAGQIRAQHSGKTVIIVSHGGVVQDIITALGGDATRCPFKGYDDLCVLNTCDQGAASVLRLKFGAED